MAGTFSQIYIQIVFAVKGRSNLIQDEWKEGLYKYIAGITRGKEQKPIIVNGMPDHVHAFVGLRQSMAISDLVRDIKNNATNFMNARKFVTGRFCRQEGFGAFSYSRPQVETGYSYIMNQERHHKRKTFRKEYIDFLNEFAIEYDRRYLFEWME